MHPADLLRASTWKLKSGGSTGWCLAIGWLVSIVLGLKLLIDFDLTPGMAGSPPANRPAAIARDPGETRPLLVMFVHPQCPCSRASVGELGQIVARFPAAAEVRIYVRTTGPEPSEWEQATVSRAASEIPGAALIADRDGEVASRLSVRTSGHVLYYGAGGELQFTGGITGARGHAGDNPGRSAVMALLAGGRATVSQHAVYGCPLFDSEHSSTGECACPIP